MKRFALGLTMAAAVAFGTGLVAPSARAAGVATATYDLGASPGGTLITGQLFIPWITMGALPTGSYLKSASVDAKLESANCDNWADDLTIYIDPTPDTPGDDGLLQIGGYNNLGSPTTKVDWGNGQCSPVCSVIATRIAPDNFPSTIDLSTAGLFLANGYCGGVTEGGVWSGTITVTYNIPGPADIFTFGLPGMPAVITGTDIAWTVTYKMGSEHLTELDPTFTMSDGATADPISGSPQNFTDPVVYTVTSADLSVVNVYTVTVTVTPISTDNDIETFSFGVAGMPQPVITETDITWMALFGADVTHLAPTYTVSPLATEDPLYPSGTERDFTTPQTYTITAEDGSTKVYTVTVTFTGENDGLRVTTYDNTTGTTFLNPISNLMAVAPSGKTTQIANIDYGDLAVSFPGLTNNETLSILWKGWFDVSKEGLGDYTFGTASDDGSVVYLDLNNDGDFADAGELIVDNNRDQGTTEATGTVTLGMNLVKIAIGYYQGGGGWSMAARFKKGNGISYGDLDPINGLSGHFFRYGPSDADIQTFGLPGIPAVITGTDIAWTVPYLPTDMTKLAPTYRVSPGATEDPLYPSGTERDFSVPQTYTVTSLDLSVTNVFTVRVDVAPIGVGPSGSGTLTFDTLPPSSKWSTLSVAGDGSTIPALAAIDDEMAKIDAASISTQLATRTDTASSSDAYWNSTTSATDDKFLVTRPTGNAMTLLMATLQNTSGSTIHSLTVSYTLRTQRSLGGEDVIKGHRVYWSKTGAKDTWAFIGDHLLAASNVTTNISFDLPPLSWADAETLYVVWADDNGSGTDADFKLDNVSFVKRDAGNQAEILTFSLPGNPAVITGTDIAWTVPFGTVITDLAPEYTVSPWATGDPVSGTKLISASQTYTITAEDGSQQVYTMTVTVHHRPITYDFCCDMRTGMQGWTQIFPKPASGTSIWFAIPADWGWIVDNGHIGDGWELDDTRFARSPEFYLDGFGDLTFQLFGSASPLPAPDVAPSAVPETAVENGGFSGLALRDVAADTYVLSKGLSANQYVDWENHSITAAELAPFVNNGKVYTLDWVDYSKNTGGGDGWGMLNDVSIPGVLRIGTSTFDLGPSPTGTTIEQHTIRPWIALGALPVGSILRSASVDAILESTDNWNWASEFIIYVDPTPETPGGDGLLQIGAYDEWGASLRIDWSNGADGPAPDEIRQVPIKDKKFAGIDFPTNIDLGTAGLFFGNGWGEAGKFGTWSGTITVTYEIPGSADMYTCGLPGNIAPVTGATVALSVAYGTDVRTLTPEYTMSVGAIGVPDSGSSQDFTNPVTYTITSSDASKTNAYTVKAVARRYGEGLLVKTYDSTQGASFLNPISNLMAVAPSGTTTQIDNIAYGDFVASFPGLTSDQQFSILWTGWFDVSKDGQGAYTFGTASDDGSVLYLDLNNDGDFADAGELIVDNNKIQGTTTLTGTVTLNMDWVRIAIGFFQDGGGVSMAARFKKGSGLAYGLLDPISGKTDHFFLKSPLCDILTFGLPGNPAVIDQSEQTIALAVPAGTIVTALAPTYTVSAGATGDPISGTAGDFTDPQTYTITAEDGSTKVYTVTVTVLPSSAADILTFVFPDLPPVTISGTNIALTVPAGTIVTALKPDYTVSDGATGDPISGTERDFTGPQTYTITAEDGSTKKVYTVTVTVLPSSAADILTFVFPDLPPVTISDTNITLTVPAGTIVTALKPDYTVSDGATGDPISGTERDFTGPQTYTITAEDGSTKKVYTVTVTVTPPSGNFFKRADINDDGLQNISDPIYLLNFLFIGGPAPTCYDAGHINEDADVNIADAIYDLNFQFIGGPRPPYLGYPNCEKFTGCTEKSKVCP